MSLQQLPTEVISKKLIFLDKECRNQEEALSYMVQKVRENGYITRENEFLQAVLARENEVSTAIGYLIAIPHGKTDVVKQPFIAFMRLKQEIFWGQNQKEAVKLIFLIGVPQSGSDRLHLKFISQLSKKLLDEKFREKLLGEDQICSVYQRLTFIES